MDSCQGLATAGCGRVFETVENLDVDVCRQDPGARRPGEVVQGARDVADDVIQGSVELVGRLVRPAPELVDNLLAGHVPGGAAGHANRSPRDA